MTVNHRVVGSIPTKAANSITVWRSGSAGVSKTLSRGSIPFTVARIKWNIGRVGLRHFPAKKASGQKPDRWFESNMFRQLSLQ